MPPTKKKQTTIVIRQKAPMINRSTATETQLSQLTEILKQTRERVLSKLSYVPKQLNNIINTGNNKQTLLIKIFEEHTHSLKTVQ